MTVYLYSHMPLQISHPVKATILMLYCKGGRRPFASKMHECTGDLTVVRLEGELRVPDQEVVGAEALEGRQPAFRGREVLRERVDVGRAGSHDPPSEDSDSAQG